MTQYSPEIWPKSITRKGDTVTRDEMHRAWEIWKYSPSPRGHKRLAWILNAVAAVPGSNEPYPQYETADGMLEVAKKAGLLLHTDGGWIFV